MNQERFEDWLRRQLRRRDWTQSDLAKRLDASTGTISRWATGARLPEPESVERLADVFGVDVDLLLTLAGHRPATEPLKLDDPVTEIVALVKRVQWNEERVETARSILQRWLEFDRKRKAKE
jgi:transcriptional regulator with XRE-family HTH domain